MPSPSPKQTGRRRSRSRGWSSSPKDSSRRPPQSPGPSSPQPLAQLPPLPPGTEVEVRVDDDGFHGSWFEATVEAFVPAQRRGSRPRCTVAYTHLPPDHPDAATTLVELSHIRPRPPLSSPEAEPFRLHEIVEAFHEDGWRSGIVLATGPLAVAFPITREVVAFQEPHHVRPRRDYVDGQWAPSQAAVAVQPKRAARVYAVGEKVEVVRDRELYGVSWYPATVAKAIDTLSYLVEYLDLKDEKGTGMLTEYLHYRFIRPAVRWEGGFWLGPGAAVEAYREGAWSAGVVRRHVGESKYEISIDGKEAELLLTTVQELLKPQYNWNGKYWNIVRAKMEIHEMHPIQALRGNSDDNDNRQLERRGHGTVHEFVPELREGMALGLMVAYVSLVDSIKKSCIEDSIASFEGKISALAYLERNGFDVKFLQLSLDRLLQMKRNHAKHLERVDKLKELLPEKESIMSGKYVLLREKEEAICQLQQKLECLHGEVEQIAKEAKDEDAEISRLKEDVNITLQERDDVVLRFQSVQAELCSTLHISD
ncbi:hypothetical protein BRADI_4g16394v3 [Brachypodium distachyon]|uniref:Agenet domain-containing protein n=1 Tax=Brachypodium distachyon TaxID=15368 RepID=A0A0Q3IPK1_BRADI|nr:hypothetical protein BRADI_4g16394v3 [Brachypodium distachyon]